MKKNGQPLPSDPGNGIKIGYARVSTDDQNPRLQIDALILAGVDERDIWVETISGTAKERPQLELMMKDVRAGDMVCVWKLDRLGRNAIDLYQLYEKIREKGADLNVITQPGMDSSTATGKLLFGILAIMAQFERDIGRERTLAGLARAKREGRVGGTKPRWPDDAVLKAAKLGTRPGARKLGYSVAGFLKAVERVKRNQQEATPQ
jgi:DNA invertase Pin-like site-specific DNA recombinase